MLRRMMEISVLLALSAGILTGCSTREPEKAAVNPAGPAATTREPVRDGESLFKQYCASCHPDGGNVSDPGRTLRGSALRRNHITTPEDIVRIMRNPISRMIRFDESTLSDRDARAIADYILKTFK